MNSINLAALIIAVIGLTLNLWVMYHRHTRKMLWYAEEVISDKDDEVQWKAHWIENGIEFWLDQDGDTCASCARCGSSAHFEDCDHCGGEGYLDRFEEDPMWYDEDELYPCSVCLGKGGFWYCISSAEWCREHPLPGCEEITAPHYEKGVEFE